MQFYLELANTFLEQKDVPYHNSSSEGAIRILKVKSKVPGGLRTEVVADERVCLFSFYCGDSKEKWCFEVQNSV